MRRIILFIALLSLVSLAGCSGSGGDAQSTFYHNNREYGKWVSNPSHTPEYRNPNTGGPMFY